ncbi:1,4-alpha-glucan branching enzyme [Meloidogyne graminicola]|uniref:1,4-alpha-glucan branching enzyme n=1 Tax=Meloidogyne graminicola TaxID=189291 RepID=A0A8S9ZY83_9BILA|nr:1,4-alpha-glucan branching enzyme [Meloidogyne graminicola]
MIICEGLENFSQSYKHYGIHVENNNSVTCLEWAPGAESLALVGDFNGWDVNANVYENIGFGKWLLNIKPKEDGTCHIAHNSVLKVAVKKGGQFTYKLSPWANYVTCATDSIVYHQQFYNPAIKYSLKTSHPKRPKSLRIYEAHVGISGSDGKINTYKDFTDNILQRIAKQGYNTIQLMAVMEHALLCLIWISSNNRFGTPDDLKLLIDEAHRLGLIVLLDVVHSHASKNVADGLNRWDGTDGAYFHNNVRGYHQLWDSRLFNYTEIETLRFLLSNLRWWIEEFGFDGFRFDGVSSMLYHSHLISDPGPGSYDDYFGLNVDTDSLVYLMLANHMLHSFFPDVITIAEEVSGMPGLCRPVSEGGQGFGRGWSKIPSTKILSTRAYLRESEIWEGHIAYAESHDQALVGDKTIAFWLMDKEMYENMSLIHSQLTPIIDRGIALHKLIRLITYGLGGEAWLNFIGNEFGHPEWLDFPRQGNNQSYHYCRRQWNLADDENLRYKFLNNWDREMNRLEIETEFLNKGPGYVSWKHQEDKIIAFERGGLLFVFNFHPTKSFSDYKFGIENPGVYILALNSDDESFGGHCRLKTTQEYHTFSEGYAGRRNHLFAYIPSRVAILFIKLVLKNNLVVSCILTKWQN